MQQLHIYGVIPEEIKELKRLEVLDLGYNKFSGALPSDLNTALQLSIFLLDNNEFTASMSPEIDEIKLLSKVRRNEKHLSSSRPRSSCCGRSRIDSWRNAGRGHIIQIRLLTTMPNLFNWFSLSASSDSFLPSSLPSPSPSISPPSPSPSPAPSAVTSTRLTPPSVFLSPTSHTESVNSPAKRRSTSGNSLMSNRHRFLILFLAVGCPALLFLLAIVLYFCQSKVSAVKPWATGLSGQLQKAFVTGVPKLKRSELDAAACEDFSNVIGSFSMGTMYKETLSSGVEIAVTSLIVASAKNWPKNLESQFRKKIHEE